MRCRAPSGAATPQGDVSRGSWSRPAVNAAERVRPVRSRRCVRPVGAGSRVEPVVALLAEQVVELREAARSTPASCSALRVLSLASSASAPRPRSSASLADGLACPAEAQVAAFSMAAPSAVTCAETTKAMPVLRRRRRKASVPPMAARRSSAVTAGSFEPTSAERARRRASSSSASPDPGLSVAGRSPREERQREQSNRKKECEEAEVASLDHRSNEDEAHEAHRDPPEGSERCVAGGLPRRADDHARMG